MILPNIWENIKSSKPPTGVCWKRGRPPIHLLQWGESIGIETPFSDKNHGAPESPKNTNSNATPKVSCWVSITGKNKHTHTYIYTHPLVNQHSYRKSP
jgi:hypothetical protein